MAINSINQGYLKVDNNVQSESTKNNNYQNTNLLKQNAPKDSFTLTNMQKTSVGTNIKKGLWFNIKQMIPFLGTHETGEIANKRAAIMKELNDPEGYSVKDNQKGTLANYGKGLLTKLAYSIPIYGTYKLGKETLEIEQAYDAMIQGKDPSELKKPGVLKSFAKGITTSIGLLIPGVSANIKGKNTEKINQLYNEIIAQETHYENWKDEQGIT